MLCVCTARVQLPVCGFHRAQSHAAHAHLTRCSHGAVTPSADLWRERYAPRAIRDDARHGSVHGRGSYRGPRGHSVLHRGGRPGSSTPSRAASGGQASAPLLAAPVHGPPPPIPEAAHPWCRRVYLHILGISTLDVIANVIEIVSADGLGSHAGAVSMVLAQGVLPISVVLSLIVLGTRCVVLSHATPAPPRLARLPALA